MSYPNCAEVSEIHGFRRANALIELGYQLLEIGFDARPKPHPTKPNEIFLLRAPVYVFGRTAQQPSFEEAMAAAARPKREPESVA
ncbi:MAG: hypothetical protein H0U59_11015 [Gemmatimonadaceae bacterium]|nr:hypothetical protein [Gemmatimonadaceae bacterium]